jgi:hypothetical protein
MVLKHQLDFKRTVPLQFFKLRPDNFPNIRLSQLAHVFSNNHQLFSDCIEVNTIKKLTKIFDVAVSEYWQTHYTFDKESPKRTKKLSAGFIELIMINTIIPLQYAYFKSRDEEVQEKLMKMLHEIQPEKNVIIDKFKGFGLLAKNRWFPLIVTSALFGLMHIMNPEVEKMGPIIMVYYIGTGLFLGIITLMDDGMELSLGFHAANNIATALLVTSEWSALQTESVFKDVSAPSVSYEILIPVVVVFPLLLIIFSKKYNWSNWKEKLTGKIIVVQQIENNQNDGSIE